MSLERIGRYQIKSELGRGGMATVYLAHDPRFKRDVAVKVLPPQFLDNPTFRARFEREAQVIAAIEHPAIVPVYDFGEEEGQPYLVMRYMLGGSLSDRLKQGPMSFTQAAQIISRLAPALDAMHQQGIVHRDLKPGNILFDHYGNAFLSDFGIAHLTQATTTLTGEAIIGTPSYMSPEQVRGDEDIDGRSDIYALGAILFEMLTGRQPYEATTPMGVALKQITEPVPRILSVKADLPPEADQVIEKAMAKERHNRYQSVSEMADTQEAIAKRLVPSTQVEITAPVEAATVVEDLQPLPAENVEVFEAEAIGMGGAASMPPPQPSPPEMERKASTGTVGTVSTASPPKRKGPVLPFLGVFGGLVVIGGVCLALAGIVYGYSLFKPPVSTETIPTTEVSAALTPEITLPAVTDLDPAPTAIPDDVLTGNGVEDGPLPTPTLGLTRFVDNFDGPEMGWSLRDDAMIKAVYEAGRFRVLVDVKHTFFWVTPDLNFADVSVGVDAEKVAGADENFFGAICRVQDEDNYYMFVISSLGVYSVVKVENGEFKHLTPENRWIYDRTIRQGKTTNHIRGDCVANNLTMYVNGLRLVRVVDNSYTEGDVGLVVAAFDIAGTNILFDNFSATVP